MTSAAQLFTVQQAATFANVHQQTVRKWIRQGQLRSHRCGRCVRITKRDLVTFITEGPKGPSAPGGTAQRTDRT